MEVLKFLSSVVFGLGIVCLAIAAASVFFGHEGFALRLIDGVYLLFLLGTLFYLADEKN